MITHFPKDVVYLFLILWVVLLVSCHQGSEDNTRTIDNDDKFEKYRTNIDEEFDEEFDPSEAEDEEQTHLNEWTVRVDPADDEVAKDLAKKYGFNYEGRVGSLDGVYRFSHDMQEHFAQDSEKRDTSSEGHKKVVPPVPVEHDPHSKAKGRVRRHHKENAELLQSNPMVMWVKRERILERVKRVPVESPNADHEYRPGHRNLKLKFSGLNDPQSKKEWYIKNTGQTSGPAGFDSKVSDVWQNYGLTGKGVVVSVLDDGMDHTHPDLKDNYDPAASTDLNGRDPDPFPNDSDAYNAHGTKCSGTIAAKANNGICGVGIAPEASIGAVRMLDGKATDSLEADALSFNYSHIDIYSCSWGPKDNGRTFGRPGKLGRMSLEASTTFGRKGKGAIFVWATGNGGMSDDDCNADGYVNSIYTLSIGSVNQYGVSTYYGEKCTSTMAVTYCSGKHSPGYFGGNGNADVITTYLHHQCTNHFVGTSSAAPLAAGIFSLVLQANGNLTWRDLQHLVVHTADLTSPFDAGWLKNGAGHRYNHKFGFGVLNAEKLVAKALKWKNVGKQHACHFPVKIKNKDIPSNGMLKINIKTDACQKCLERDKDKNGKCKNAVTKLEHVVVTLTLKHRRRGQLSIQLHSPHKTYSQLLHNRKNDDSKAGLKNWSFMTVYNWGENPAGKWTLILKDGNAVYRGAKGKRDNEIVYMKMLNRRKRKSKAQSNEEGFSGGKHKGEDIPSVETYKKAWDEIQKKYSNNVDENVVRQKFSREISDDDEDQQKFSREVSDDEEPQPLYTRDIDEEEKYISKRSVSDNSFNSQSSDSPIAGVVKGISFTFYGTAE